jgi:hypothetical protein
MIVRHLQILGALLFAALALSAIAAASAFGSTGWLVDGKPITEAEGALATETEEELELTDLGATPSLKVSCKDILDGTVGPEVKDEITEVLNVAKEKIGTGLPLSCTVTNSSICAGNKVSVQPVHLPWLTELEGMEAEAYILDHLFGSGAGKEPGYTIDCETLLGLAEDICEGLTSAKAENTTENDVLEIFSEVAGIESQKRNCTSGGAGVGDIKGEGLVLLTSGKTLEAAGVTFLPAVVNFEKKLGLRKFEIMITGGTLELFESQRTENANYLASDPNKCIKNAMLVNCTVEVELTNALAPQTLWRGKFMGIAFEPWVILENK